MNSTQKKPVLTEIELCGLRCLLRGAPQPGLSPGILFLHGAGSRNSMDTLAHHSLLTESSPLLSRFGLLMPLLEGNTWFDVFEHLIRLSACAAEAIGCDPDRLALLGVSMGGFGAWQLAMSSPDPFSALVPLCGGGQAWNAARLKNIPVWAFHGALDQTVSPLCSQMMTEAVNASGGSARLTLYPDCSHNCWSRAFADDELYAWMGAQRRRLLDGPAPQTHKGSAFG